jgi:hypothetical protein
LNREIGELRERIGFFAYFAYFAVILLSSIGTGFEAPYFPPLPSTFGVRCWMFDVLFFEFLEVDSFTLFRCAFAVLCKKVFHFGEDFMRPTS